MIYYDDEKCGYYARKYFRGYISSSEQYDGLYSLGRICSSTTVRSIPVQDEVKIVDDGKGLKCTKPNYKRPGPVVKNLLEINGGYGGRKVGYYIDAWYCWHGDEFGENLNELNTSSARPVVKI